MDHPRKTVYRFLLQLLLLLGLYLFTRGVFIAVNHGHLDINSTRTLLVTLLHGARFDLSAIFMTNFLFLVLAYLPVPFAGNVQYRKALGVLFVVVNAFCLLLNLIDVAYFPYILKRMQADAFMFVQKKQGGDLVRLLPLFLKQYWYNWLLWLILVVILWKVWFRIDKIRLPQPATLRSVLVQVLVFFGILSISVIGIRGGIQERPIDVINAADAAGVRNMPGVLNAAFTVIKTWDKKGIEEVHYFDLPANAGIHSGKEGFRKMNVVIVLVESLSRDFLPFFGGKGHTPFLDSLFSESLVFENTYANARESIKAIPAILASLPAWQNDAFIFSAYSTNRVTSMANLLTEQGYSTSFFHGGHNGTMGFDAFSRLAGFERYIGLNEYGNMADYDGQWGIWDEPFLKFMAKQLATEPQPFLSVAFTLNPHHPFRVPDKYAEELKQPGHPVATSLAYVDQALRRFFDVVSTQPWFNNTLFVITADHAGPVTEGMEQTPITENAVPLAFYSPFDPGLKGRIAKTAQQIDILPSVMSYLNYPKPYFALGNNLFAPAGTNHAITYKEGVYQYIDSTWCYLFDGKEKIGLYNWRNDPMLRSPLADEPAEWNRIDSTLKANIQLYNYSLIHDRLVLEK